MTVFARTQSRILITTLITHFSMEQKDFRIIYQGNEISIDILCERYEDYMRLHGEYREDAKHKALKLHMFLNSMRI